FPCYGSYPAYEDYGHHDNIDWFEVLDKALKLPDTKNNFPPPSDYHVIRLRRDLKQQVKSMVKFMEMIGLPTSWTRSTLRKFTNSLKMDNILIDLWARAQKVHIVIDFEDLINNPKSVIGRLNTEFELNLPYSAADCVVNRSSDCYNGMLELSLIRSK
ncbi:hypothetical protein LCGC14_0938020, partial [marine sediment metagenome]